MDFILDLIFTTLFEVLFDEIVIILALILMGWIGFSIYRAVKSRKQGLENG